MSLRAKQWHCYPVSVCRLFCFSTSTLLYGFFCCCWDSINGIQFTRVNLYRCLCEAGQSVIKLKSSLDSGGILNKLNLFIVESCQVVPKRSPYNFSVLPRIAGLFTWQFVHTLGKPFLTPQEYASWPGWSRNSYLGYLWPLVPEKVATVVYKGLLGHNSIRIPREMRLGRQNSNFSVSSHGPRRGTLKVNIAPEII